MAQTARIILFTADEANAPKLRRSITTLPHLRIVAELDEPSLLSQAAVQFPCDLLLADLDPGAPMVIECLRQLRETQPDLPIFALSKQKEGDVILQAMKAGIKEYLVKPLNVEELEQAVSRVASTQTTTKEPGKLISVMGSAGGVGCTTLATNLAVELASLAPEQMVAIVDLDFRFGHVATLLDVHGQHTVADLCSTQEELDPQMIMKALIKHESGVYVLRRPHSFAQAEMITAAHCASVLTSLQEMCAYVVVDGPTRHDPGGRSVLDAADYNFMVLQLLVTSVRNTDRMIQEIGVQGFNTDRILLICNRLGRDSAHLEVEQVETILDRKVFAALSDDWKNVSASINIGQPLKVYNERAKIRQEIQNLAKMIHSPETMEESSRKGGLLGRFFRKGPGMKEEKTVDASTGTTPAVQS
ncbi:MAG: response regulator [Phycisphaerales bacterium]|nr:response regulator [Phycisphaerales bacterium]